MLNDICGNVGQAFESKRRRKKKADSVCDGESVHVLGDAVYVGDVGPFLGVGVDAHVYQFSQLGKRKMEEFRLQVYEFINSIIITTRVILMKPLKRHGRRFEI